MTALATLDAGTAAAYLVERGLLGAGEPAQARALGDGVSASVVAVLAGERAVVVKQALPQLRVADLWPAKRERALTEAAALEALGRLTPGAVPVVLDVDRAALAFTMRHAPAAWRNWKRTLLAGEVDPAVAARLGAVLAAWHAGTAGEPAIAARFADYEAFDQLRIDPYHHTVAARRPELAPVVEALVERMVATRACLVHGDFSPKNVLVGEGELWVLDAEVAHCGDPAFDLGFMLCHLTLKAIHRPGLAGRFAEAAGAFMDAYRRGVPDALRAPTDHLIAHLGCLLAARADGKSPAEYLDAPERDRVRALARALLLDPPGALDEVWRLADRDSRAVAGPARWPSPPVAGARNTRIEAVFAWEALDSRGRPTVACAVRLAGGARGRAVVPSGASTGTHEAVELRDGDPGRYGGRGVRRAVENVNGALAQVAVGLDAADQPVLDAALRAADGTANLSRLGANATLAVSVAAALAAADAERTDLHDRLDPGAEPLLPLPMVNVLSGGAHAAGGLDMQDFLVVPLGAQRFAAAIEIAWRVRTAAERLAADRGLTTGLVADEGGLGLPLPSHRAALDLLVAAIEQVGLVPGEEAAIAIDVAATQLATGDGYRLAAEDRTLTARELVDELAGWCAAYPIVSLEDPVADTDAAGWELASAALGDRVQLIGDDLFVTDAGRLEAGIRDRIANAVLVKPNQVGVLSDAAEVVERARAAGYATIVSARSGDTEDAWLADLAVGWRAGQIKVGSLTRAERTAKWNRLLEIEAAAGDRAQFAGRAALAP